MELVIKALHAAGALELAVLILLLVFSVVSWALILMKLKKIYQFRRNIRNFLARFDAARDFEAVRSAMPSAGNSPVASIFKAALETLEHAEQDRRPEGKPRAVLIPTQPKYNVEGKVRLNMQRASKDDFGRLNWGLGFLASIGSASPFIGLFGTVWGIMHTFQILGDTKSASFSVVAPGISAALIATAAGLAVAIPAVMAYNWFLGQCDEFQEQADLFMERVILLVRASGFLDDAAPLETAPCVGVEVNSVDAPRQVVPVRPPEWNPMANIRQEG